MKTRFTKMQGIGNDYIYFNCLKKRLANPAETARKLSDRHFGIGGDGIVLIAPSRKADLKMRIFNADGSEAETCGNAIRCVAKYTYEKGLIAASSIKVETLGGVKDVELLFKGSRISALRVDMGEPVLEARMIPVNLAREMVLGEELKINGESFRMSCVSMGNPHCVIFVDKITDNLVLGMGPLIERRKIFPKRTNVEFAEVLNKQEVRMRVWERGSGETLGCGSGACATAVAAALNNLTEREITVHLLGGKLGIEWAANNHVYMTGPAETVFEGEIDIR